MVVEKTEKCKATCPKCGADLTLELSLTINHTLIPTKNFFNSKLETSWSIDWALTEVEEK